MAYESKIIRGLMPHSRYYINDPLLESSSLEIEGQEFHHLSRVMRARIGDLLEIVNGKGVLAQAKIMEMEKQRALLRIESSIFQEKSPFEIILVQAIPRPSHLEIILEKGTELGMTAIWLLHTERSEKSSFSANQMTRMHSILVAAMKQCGRLYLPKIEVKPSLDKWKSLDHSAYYGNVNPNAIPAIDALNKETKADGIVFFIGPEGGFTEKEEKLLQQLGVKGVKLHENILRTETAALIAVFVSSYTYTSSS